MSVHVLLWSWPVLQAAASMLDYPRDRTNPVIMYHVPFLLLFASVRSLQQIRARPIIGETPNASAASPSWRRESAELVAVHRTVHPRIKAHPLVDFMGHALTVLGSLLYAYSEFFSSDDTSEETEHRGVLVFSGETVVVRMVVV